MALGILYLRFKKVPIYPIFYLLKGDHRCEALGLG